MAKKIFPIIVDKDLSMPYFQRGRDHFMVYSLDGSMTGRKSGFYFPPVIFLDSLKLYIKDNGKVCNLHQYIKRAVIDISETTHYFELKDKKIKLTYFVPEDFSGLKIFIKANKKVELEIEPKFSFNYVWRENPIKQFSVIERSDGIYARSDFDTKIWCMFKANKRLRWANNRIKFSGQNILLDFATSTRSERNLERHMQRVTEKGQRTRKKNKYYSRIIDSVEFKCDDDELSRAFILAKYNLRLLRHQQHDLGRGFFAGLPDFIEYYGRDSFWSAPGILSIGDFDCVKSMLNIFARYQSTYETETKQIGEVPNEIWMTGEPNYYGVDPTLLFVYAMHYYYTWTADSAYVKSIFEIIKKAVELQINLSENHMIRHKPEGFVRGVTWMDSYSRRDTAIEIQALFVKSLEYGAELAKVAGDKALVKRWTDYSKKAKQKLKLFWRNGRFIDHLHKNGKYTNEITVNPFILLLLGLADKKKAEAWFKKADESGLVAEMGVRSRAKLSKGYDPSSYHKGGIWPLLNGWAALAYYKYNKKEKAYGILKKQHKLYWHHVPGLAPEWLHGNKFTVSKINAGPRDVKTEALGAAPTLRYPAWCQLWSSSLFLQSVIEGLCGVKPDPLNKKINIIPKLPKNINKIELKKVHVFDKVADIKIERKNGKIIVDKKIKKCEH